MIGKNTIAKVVQTLVKRAKIDRFFTNHSLRRSGGTRLFRAGIDRKLVKEHTGHRSDAVDSYQVTSHDQRKLMSNVIQGEIVPKVEQNNKKVNETGIDYAGQNDKTDQERSAEVVVNHQNAVDIVSELLKKIAKKGKTTITIKVEVDNE